MSYSLNSLKGGYMGFYRGATIGLIKEDTTSLNYSSHTTQNLCFAYYSQESDISMLPDSLIKTGSMLGILFTFWGYGILYI